MQFKSTAFVEIVFFPHFIGARPSGIFCGVAKKMAGRFFPQLSVNKKKSQETWKSQYRLIQGAQMLFTSVTMR